MGEVTKLEGVPMRPETISLFTAIENAIEEVAVGKLTPTEVLGTLELVKQDFFQRTFIESE